MEKNGQDNGKLLAGAAAATAALVGTAALAIVRVLSRVQPHFRFNTMFGHACVFNVEDSTGRTVRMLAIDRSVQSGAYLGEHRFALPFEYYRAIERAVMAKGDAREVLMLGGGAFAYPRFALTAHGDMRMDVVEIDPAIVDIARRWFFLDELEQRAGERLAIHTVDARGFLEACTARYDVIVNDLFAGFEMDAALLSDEGLELVKEHLAEDGIYVVNAVSSPLDYRQLAETGELLERHFSSVEMVECTDADFSDDENYLFVCRP